jgi:hypothetical protein
MSSKELSNVEFNQSSSAPQMQHQEGNVKVAYGSSFFGGLVHESITKRSGKTG